MNRSQLCSVAARALAAASLLALAPTTARAQPDDDFGEATPTAAVAADAAPKPKEGISACLGTLDWGANHQAVLAKLKADLDARYEERLEKTSDTLQVDRILREKSAAFAAIEKTFISFSGQRTGYESSLIADDFKANNDESVLRIDERDAQRYFFFLEDRLWKVLVAYNTGVSTKVPFPSFVDQVKSKYGAPLAVDTDSAGGKKVMLAAHWEDGLTHLIVEDRTGFFGTFVMKFVEKNEGLALERKRSEEERPVAPSQSARAEGLMSDIMGDVAEVDTDVVDRLTGVEHTVDMESGRPSYDTLTRVVEEDPAPKKNKDGTASKAAGPKPKPAESKPANDFIIY